MTHPQEHHTPRRPRWYRASWFPVSLAILAIVAVSIAVGVGIKLVDTVNNQQASEEKAFTVLERRSPSLAFYVCAYAHLGDFTAAVPRLNKDSSQAQIAQFDRIAQGVRDALKLTTKGGCVDPRLPVTVPPPVTIPPK